MGTTLVVATSPRDALTAELVSAARALGDTVVAGVLSADPSVSISIEGVDRAIGVQLPDDAPCSETWPRAIAAMMDHIGASTVLMAFTWDTAAAAAVLAVERDLALVSDAVGLTRESGGAILVDRAVYGGKVLARLEVPAETAAIVLARPGSWPPAAQATRPLRLEMLELSGGSASRIRRVGFLEPPPNDDDLTLAEIIFAVGRGIGSQDTLPLFMDAAKRCHASIGASRPLVDLGWVPRQKQVGQSGVTVKPRVYVAFGISGALQHLAGMQGAGLIIAINTDGDAPIFDTAHFGSFVDAVAVARHLASDD